MASEEEVYGMESDPIDSIRQVIRNDYEGHTILKELIQNARDAKATNFIFKTTIGNKEADHPMLKVPAIIVFNDGTFDKEKDEPNIRKIGSSHKLSDKHNVGKYGLGMKSIFHYSDMFFYATSEKSAVVNPWKRYNAKTHQEWNSKTEKDNSIIHSYLLDCLKDCNCSDGFMILIPLRNGSYDYTITPTQVKIESFFERFNLQQFNKNLVDMLGVLSSCIETSLSRIIIKTPQVETDLRLVNCDNTKKIEIVENNKSIDEYYIISKKYPEALVPELSEIKKTNKLPTKTYHDSVTGKEEIQSPYNENQEPTIVSILHKKNSESAKLSYKFCCYLPLDDEKQANVYDIYGNYDCDVYLHCEFETDGGRRQLLGIDFTQQKFNFPTDSIDEIYEDKQAQVWWNIVLVQKIIATELPDFIYSTLLKTNYINKDEIVKTYNDYVKRICLLNSKLITKRNLFYKQLTDNNHIWLLGDDSCLSDCWICLNEIILNELQTTDKTYNEIFKEFDLYIQQIRFIQEFICNDTTCRGITSFNAKFSQENYNLLLDAAIMNRIPIIFMPVEKDKNDRKLSIPDEQIEILGKLFKPFSDTIGFECYSILDSFAFEPEKLLELLQFYHAYPICPVHNVKEIKNAGKLEYITYDKLISLYGTKCLYKSIGVTGEKSVLQKLVAFVIGIEFYSISEQNILRPLFSETSIYKLLDQNNTKDVMDTICANPYMTILDNESAKVDFINYIDNFDLTTTNYEKSLLFILSGDPNFNGNISSCNCNEAEIYVKLFKQLKEKTVYVSSVITSALEQKNFPEDIKLRLIKTYGSFDAKNKLVEHTETEFYEILTESERFALLKTLNGSDGFKKLPLHKTLDGKFVAFTENCFLVTDKSISLPNNYTNETVYFIELSNDEELRSYQENCLRDSILTYAKVVSILLKDEKLDLTAAENEDYIFFILGKLCSMSDNDLLELRYDTDVMKRQWLPLKNEMSVSFYQIINLPNKDANIHLKATCKDVYIVDDLLNGFRTLTDKRLFLETKEDVCKVLLSKYKLKLLLNKNTIRENWNLISNHNSGTFFDVLNTVYGNDSKKYEYLENENYITKMEAPASYANFIISLSKSKLETDDYNKAVKLVKQCFERPFIVNNPDTILRIEGLYLPTEARGWNLVENISQKINKSFSSKQQLHKELRDVIPLDMEDKKLIDTEHFKPFTPSESNIKKYFGSALENSEIDSRLVGLLLYILCEDYRTVAENNGFFTDTDKSVLESALTPVYTANTNPDCWMSKCAPLKQALLSNVNNHRFELSISIRQGEVITTKSLKGNNTDVRIQNNREGGIISEIKLEPLFNRRPRLVIQFLYDDLSTASRAQIKDAIRLIFSNGYFQRNISDDFFDKILASEQASIDGTTKQIFNEIFPTLKILKLKSAFKQEFDAYNETNYGNGSLKDALENLKKIIEANTDNCQSTILEGVRNYLKANQYDHTRILYELFQNADDALGQQIEINEKTNNGKSIDSSFIIDSKGNKLCISHFGREINFRPSESFPSSYKYDLGNMIQIASSDKGESGDQKHTTGKFGLGFKSVYFYCDKPIIRSGRLHFEIIAGLFPKVISPEKLKDNETRIELTNDTNKTGILTSFEANVELSVIFAKYIRTITISKNKWTWNPKIYYQNNFVTYEGNEKFKVLRFPNTTLVFYYDSVHKKITTMPDTFQKVWNTTPLDNAFKNLPFAINTAFEVDTGRRSLATINDRIIIDAALEIAKGISVLYKNIKETEVEQICSILLNAGLKSDGKLEPISKEVCKVLYKDHHCLPDGYGKLVAIDESTRIFSISENAMNNYVSESAYAKTFIGLANMLSSVEGVSNVLISDTAKRVSSDLTPSKLVMKENNVPILADYLFCATKEHRLTANLFQKFIDYGLYEIAKSKDSLNNEILLLSKNGTWIYTKDLSKINFNLSNSYSNCITELKSMIKISANSVSPSDSNDDENHDAKPTDLLNLLSQKERLLRNYYDTLYSPSYFDSKTFKINGELILEESDNGEYCMNETWCILLFAAVCQSLGGYFGHRDSFIRRTTEAFKSFGIFKMFITNDKHLEEVYDLFLKNSKYSEEYLRPFEMLLRLYKIRRDFTQFYTVIASLPYKQKFEDFQELLITAYDEELADSSVDLPAYNATLKQGGHMLLRELLRNDFWQDCSETDLLPIKQQAFMTKDKVSNKLGLGKVYESRDIYDAIKKQLPDNPTLDDTYDILLLAKD